MASDSQQRTNDTTDDDLKPLAPNLALAEIVDICNDTVGEDATREDFDEALMEIWPLASRGLVALRSHLPAAPANCPTSKRTGGGHALPTNAPVPLTPEHIERVALMASGDPKWDLSPNDIEALAALLHEVRQSWQALNDAVTILDHNKMLDGSYQVTKQDGRRLRIALGIERQKGHQV